MKRYAPILGILLTLAGCAASQQEALASFFVNNTAHNSLIVGRRPQYGDGQPDGCIVETAFSLRLRVTSVASDSIAGVVYVAGTTTPVLGAMVRALPPAPAEAITLVTSNTGHFALRRAWQVQRLEVAMPGYRTLTIDLGSKKLL